MCVCLVGCVLEQVIQVAGASPQSPLGTVRTLSLGVQVSACFYGRETEAGRGESVGPIVCGKSGPHRCVRREQAEE